MILAAVKRDQFSFISAIAVVHPMVVVATLDNSILSKIKSTIQYNDKKEIPVYFYESG